MARSRNIKPGFFLNDTLADISPMGRLLFIGLWTIADFKGCVAHSPRKIKAQVLPYDECDVEALLINLEQDRFIRSYVNCGKKYIKIVNFELHQNPHKNEREAGSDIPDYDEKSNEINELKHDGTKPDLIGSTRAEPGFLIPDSLTLIPDSKRESRAKALPLPLPLPIPDWINAEHWNAWHSSPKRKKASDAQKAVALGKLSGWRDQGLDYAGALENAAAGGYQGLFLPDKPAIRAGPNAARPKYAAAAAAIFDDEPTQHPETIDV